MQKNFQPISVDVTSQRTKSTKNSPNKAMWGSHMKDTAIDQSVAYQKTKTKRRNVATMEDGISVIQNIIGGTKSKVPINTEANSLVNLRGPLQPTSDPYEEEHTAHGAQMVKMNRGTHSVRRKNRKKGKHSANSGVQKMYKDILGADNTSVGTTGQSMALRAVTQTANMAKIARQNGDPNRPTRRKSYEDILTKVQNAEDSDNHNECPPDTPLHLPRGRLITTHVFLLGRKMTVEILRIGRVGVQYQVHDEENKAYLLETSEREIFDQLNPNQQAVVATLSVEDKIPLLIGRMGFQVSKEDRRKKELAILKFKGGASGGGSGGNGGIAKKTGRWGKMRKLTSDIGEDMFQRRINADSDDVASLVGLGMLKVKQNMSYDAVVLFVKAIRIANIVRCHPESGRHELVRGASVHLSANNAVFGAKFWNTMAKAAFETYLDDLRLQVLNVALDSSEIASHFFENIANQRLWILRGRIHESLGHLQVASDLYEHCISHFTHGQQLNEVMFRAAAVAKRLGRFTRCVGYMEYVLINPPLGFTQKDILFQVARAHEQEGKVDVASDGFKQAFKFYRREVAKKKAEDTNESTTRAVSHNLNKEPRNWRQWINSQTTWDIEAERYFSGGYFSLSIDMIQRSLMLGEKHMQEEMLKPFGGESENIRRSSSTRWWKAAVSARHLGELHTSLKACEEAVLRDPNNSIASAALQKWNLFFIDGDQADDEDPDMMMDAENWGKHVYSDEFNSEGLKHAANVQNRAALKMEALSSHGKKEGERAQKARKAKAGSRRLSVSAGRSVGAASAATAAAAAVATELETKMLLKHVIENKEEKQHELLNDDEDYRRMEAKRRKGSRRRKRPMSASAKQPTKQISTNTTVTAVNKKDLELRRILEMEFEPVRRSPWSHSPFRISQIQRPSDAISLISASQQQRQEETVARQAKIEQALERHATAAANKHLRLEKLVGSALRRLAIMGSNDIEELKFRSIAVGAQHGFAGTIHAFIATILLEDKALMPIDIKSHDFMTVTSNACSSIDVGALMTSSSEHRPNLKDLRSTQQSKSSASISLKLLSPNGKGAPVITTEQSTEQVERLFRGRQSTSARFVLTTTNSNSKTKSGTSKLNDMVDKSIRSHMFKSTGRSPNNNEKSSRSPGTRRSRSSRASRASRSKSSRSALLLSINRTSPVMRITKIPSPGGVGIDLASINRTGSIRSWKGERSRRNHSEKQRRNYMQEKIEYDKIKPRVLIRGSDGVLQPADDPILMSRILRTVAKEKAFVKGETLEDVYAV